MRKFFVTLTACFLFFSGFAQTVKSIAEKKGISFRGLSVVNNKIVWVSGSSGTIGKSVDGGKNWQWTTVAGYEKVDFRDIEAFDAKTAIIMGIDSPAYILRTIDGGQNWTKVYQNNQSGIFLDAMEFWNDQSGIAIGDPIDNRFFIVRTFDGGKTWQDLPYLKRPIADSGEACFASSGTNIRKLNKQEAVFITGGLVSNLVIREQKIALPFRKGFNSSGANSIAIKNKNSFMVVGGDFSKKDSTILNCTFSTDGGKTWQVPKTSPTGYRSCVEYLSKSKWITCGLNGVDITHDDGQTFSSISQTGYHVVRKAKKGNAVFFAGGGGRIGKLEE